MRSTDQSQRGASTVEFAVITPLFVALLFAIVEFGMVLYTKGMLAHATREGARVGVVYANPRMDDTAIQGAVMSYLNQCGLTSTAVVSVNPPLASRTTGVSMTVTADYTYSFLVLPKNINNYLLGKRANINLQTKTVMRME